MKTIYCAYNDDYAVLSFSDNPVGMKFPIVEDVNPEILAELTKGSEHFKFVLEKTNLTKAEYDIMYDLTGLELHFVKDEARNMYYFNIELFKYVCIPGEYFDEFINLPVFKRYTVCVSNNFEIRSTYKNVQDVYIHIWKLVNIAYVWLDFGTVISKYYKITSDEYANFVVNKITCVSARVVLENTKSVASTADMPNVNKEDNPEPIVCRKLAEDIYTIQTGKEGYLIIMPENKIDTLDALPEEIFVMEE